MPVECDVEVGEIGQEGFHAVDHEVMRHAFDIHNTMGRFFDERIYQKELAERCLASGLEVHREVQLRVIHQDFVKTYYQDLLVQRGAVYELKTTDRLSNAHQGQLINYLLLAGLHHGKLLNLRPSSVESRFVSSRLRKGDRTAFELIEDGWDSDGDVGQHLRDHLRALLSDWGLFLEANLYREALLHLLNGPGYQGNAVDIVVSGRTVGAQTMYLLNNHTAWHLSAIRQHHESYKTHIHRLLKHTRLRRLHWVNLHQHTVTLTTLTNRSAPLPMQK